MEFNLELMEKELNELLIKEGFVRHNIVSRNGLKQYDTYFKEIPAKEGTKLVFTHTTGLFRKKSYVHIYDSGNDYRFSLVTLWENALFYEGCPAFKQLCEGKKEEVQKVLDLIISNKPVSRIFVYANNHNSRLSCGVCMVDKYSRVCIQSNW